MRNIINCIQQQKTMPKKGAGYYSQNSENYTEDYPTFGVNKKNYTVARIL